MMILMWIVFGFVVGWIARLLAFYSNTLGHILVHCLVGVVGALLGGFGGLAIGLYPSVNFTGGIFMAILGAVIGSGVFMLHQKQW